MFVAPAAAQNNSVSTSAQATDGDSVVIDTVEIEEGGWVAVYKETATGNLGELYGAESLGSGSHVDVIVNTSEFDESGFLVAALHNDEVPGEFDPQGDPLVEENGETVRDTFFVAIGTQEVHQTYANAKQQRREFRNKLDDLQTQLDNLEDEEGDYEEERQRIQDDISTLENDIADLDNQIDRTEDLLQQVEDGGGSTDDGDDGGSNNETDDGGSEDGTEDDSNNETDDGGESGGEGLPGFTVVGTLVAVLTGGALARRRQ